MTTIYRVQDKDGRGPWKPGFSAQWVGECDQERADMRPLQHPRAVRRSRWHLGYGCRTLSQLRRWIRQDEYATLIAHGYAAVRIDDARIIACDEHQVMFERKIPLREGAKVVNLYPERP